MTLVPTIRFPLARLLALVLACAGAGSSRAQDVPGPAPAPAPAPAPWPAKAASAPDVAEPERSFALPALEIVTFDCC